MGQFLSSANTGNSLQAIADEIGVAKSTVHRVLSRLAAKGISPVEATQMSLSDLEATALEPRSVRIGYYQPDFEAVYHQNHIRGRNHRSLQELWQQYRDGAPEGALRLGYKAFCKAYGRFTSNLPASCREMSLTNQWAAGDVAMIDYSGDGLIVTDKNTGTTRTAQVFVGVLGNSGYIFHESSDAGRQSPPDVAEAT